MLQMPKFGPTKSTHRQNKSGKNRQTLARSFSLSLSLVCVCVGCLFLRTPSRAPYRTPSACANRAAYPDPPPGVPDPESIDAQAAYRRRLEMHLDTPVYSTILQRPMRLR